MPPPPGPPGVSGPGAGGMPPLPPNPEVEKLTNEQKKLLKQLHASYGQVGKSPLSIVVDGQSDQTFDIELKLKK